MIIKSFNFAVNSVNTSIAENTANSTIVHTAMATGDSGTTYSLSGIDSDDFNLNPNTGELTFISIPDYERPTDNGNNNTYSFTITANNSDGSANQTIIINVTDIIGDPFFYVNHQHFFTNRRNNPVK